MWQKIFKNITTFNKRQFLVLGKGLKLSFWVQSAGAGAQEGTYTGPVIGAGAGG